MGLDLICGAIVLVAALRGWFRGFFTQAVRIIGLVGAVYLAGPMRDLARPAVAERLGSIDPAVLDRLLWWIAAAIGFVVLSGVANGLVGSYRRRARERSRDGLAGPSHRGDQSAGALFGAAKGAIVVAFLVAGVERYAPDYLRAGGWVGEQVGTSRLLDLSARHEPARRLWEAPPVRRFVDHVRRMGFGAAEPAPDAPEAFVADDPPAPVASESPGNGPGPDLDAQLDEVRRELERLERMGVVGPR